MCRILNSRPVRALKLLSLIGATAFILNLPLTLPASLIFTDAMAQVPTGSLPPGSPGSTATPEMSDYLAMVFVAAAGAMAFRMRRRAVAFA